jgi:hypothetical protein
MRTDELINEWAKDSKIDNTELGKESLIIPQLHSKYLNEFYLAKTLYNKLSNDYKKLFKVKQQYYLGILSEEELKEYGWEPQPLKILKSDIPTYIESDQDVIEIQSKIKATEDKIEFIENIIRTLNNRGYLIKNAIEWEKFKMGL